MNLSPTEVLLEAPGVAGINKIVQAGITTGMDAASMAALAAATTELGQFLKASAGSQLGLARRLKQSTKPNPEQISLQSRERRFQAEAKLMGASEQLHFATFAYRPSPRGRHALECIHIEGCFAHVRTRIGLPLYGNFSSHVTDPPSAQAVHAFDSTEVDDLLLKRYTSRPLPTRTRTSPEPEALDIIDSPSLADGQPVDLFAGGRAPCIPDDTSEYLDRHLSQRVALRFPANALVFDLWLHKSCATQFEPYAGQYTKGPEMRRTPKQRWYDRFPTQTGVRQLDPSSTESKHHPRVGELALYAFELAHWDPSEFWAFRDVQAFPMVGIDHIIGVELAGFQD